MSEQPETEPTAPPDLPKKLVDLGPAVIVGTAVWAVVLIGALIVEYVLDRDAGFWPSTAVAGFGLGLLGLTVVAWQRKASRSGSRGAQRGL